jgi:hypothetical protein
MDSDEYSGSVFFGLRIGTNIDKPIEVLASTSRSLVADEPWS